MKTLLAILLVLCVAWPASAATSLEFRYWGPNLYMGSPTTPRYNIELQHELRGPSRVGFRVWGAMGEADDYCPPTCFQHTFLAGDLTYRVAPWLRVFGGRYRLYREYVGTEYGFMSHLHEGWRAGVMANVQLRPRLILVGEWAYLWDAYQERSPWTSAMNGENGSGTWGGPGAGQYYRLAAQYTLSPTTYATVGYESWGFHLPGGPHGPWGYYADHVWRGWFAGVGIRK